VHVDITQGTLTQERGAQTTGGDCTPAASGVEQRGIDGGREVEGQTWTQDHIASVVQHRRSGKQTNFFFVILLVWVYQQECLDKNILNILVIFLSKTSEIFHM
jgi:hypothetical protein